MQSLETETQVASNGAGSPPLHPPKVTFEDAEKPSGGEEKKGQGLHWTLKAVVWLALAVISLVSYHLSK